MEIMFTGCVVQRFDLLFKYLKAGLKVETVHVPKGPFALGDNDTDYLCRQHNF